MHIFLSFTCIALLSAFGNCLSADSGMHKYPFDIEGGIWDGSGIFIFQPIGNKLRLDLGLGSDLFYHDDVEISCNSKLECVILDKKPKLAEFAVICTVQVKSRTEFLVIKGHEAIWGKRFPRKYIFVPDEKIDPIGRASVISPNGLRVRASPTIDAPVVKVLPKGAKVNILLQGRGLTIDGKMGRWVKIGRNQWVFDGYLKDEKYSSATP